MDFNWKTLLTAGATTLGTLIGGPLGPGIGAAVGAILGVNSDDEKSMTQAMVNATPEQKAAILKLDNDYKIQMEQLRIDEGKAQLSAAVASDSGQVTLMLEDARSNDKFRAYGRPAAIWMSVAGVGMQCVVYPIVQWVFTWYDKVSTLPDPDGMLLTFLATSLLGVGAMRTIDNVVNKRK